jgi:hypothetical protein
MFELVKEASPIEVAIGYRKMGYLPKMAVLFRIWKASSSLQSHIGNSIPLIGHTRRWIPDRSRGNDVWVFVESWLCYRNIISFNYT